MTTRHHSSDRRNRRPLDDIAADIHKLQRSSLFAIGDLLIEAKEQLLDHGEFLPWLEGHFEWSEDTAENYMGASRLAAKFRNIRNLKLAKTTIYELVELAADDNTTDELMEDIIAALAEQATRDQLKHAAATEIIELTGLRWEFGDYPEAALYALWEVKQRAEPWSDKAADALMAQEPTTEEAARAIVENVEREYRAAENDDPDETDTEETDTEETDTDTEETDTDTEETDSEETDREQQTEQRTEQQQTEQQQTEQQTEEEEQTEEEIEDDPNALPNRIRNLLTPALKAEIEQFNRDSRSMESRDGVRNALRVLINTARDLAVNIDRRTTRMLDRGL
jgi:hypothetical protein